MCFTIYLHLELRTAMKVPVSRCSENGSTSGLSSPSPLPFPSPSPFLPPIFPGKRRKTNWAVEPLEFSICPKLTPELSRPPRFRSFSEFLVSLSFFFSSFLSSPAEEPKPNISARFIPSKKRGRNFAG